MFTLPTGKLHNINVRRAQFREELQIAAERYYQEREETNGDVDEIKRSVIVLHFAPDNKYPF